MKGIVYVSQTKVPFTSAVVEELAQFASTCNSEYEITGYLYYEKELFLQYIEGDDLAISTLLRNIQKDSRHEVLNILEDNELTARRFPTWHMNQLTKTAFIQINVENILTDYLINSKKLGNSFLNPENIWRMVNKLSEHRSIISSKVS